MYSETAITRLAKSYPYETVQVSYIPSVPPRQGQHLFINLFNPRNSELPLSEAVPIFRGHAVDLARKITESDLLEDTTESFCISIVRQTDGPPMRVYRVSVPLECIDHLSHDRDMRMPLNVPGCIESTQLPEVEALL